MIRAAWSLAAAITASSLKYRDADQAQNSPCRTVSSQITIDRTVRSSYILNHKAEVLSRAFPGPRFFRRT
jgi:hypothetical protein